MRNIVDGLLSQSGGDLGAEQEAVVSPSRPARAQRGRTGNVAGTVIQAGDVYGGLTIA